MIFAKSPQSQGISGPATELLLGRVNPNLPPHLFHVRWHASQQRLLSSHILHRHSLQQGQLWGQIWGSTFLFALLLSFIGIWRNHNINLKEIKYCISPHPCTQDIQCLRAHCWAPRYGYTPQPHLSSMSSWNKVHADTLIPQPYAY